MNIHEYQAKELFQKYGVATAPGKVAHTPEEAGNAAREIGGGDLVVKAQIHAGGRGKGTFKNGFKGGVHLVKTPGEAQEIASRMLGQVLVTHQTGPEGRLVNQVLVAQGVDIAKEYYLAILMDRATGATSGHRQHGRRRRHREPSRSTRRRRFSANSYSPALGLQHYQARKVAQLLGFRRRAQQTGVGGDRQPVQAVHGVRLLDGRG